MNQDTVQLRLFEPEPQEEPLYNEFFQTYHGWIPKVGEEASIQEAISENLSGGSNYCSGAQVVVKRIEGRFAIVETTDEYVQRLIWAGWQFPTKQTYRVKLNQLGPNFYEKQTENRPCPPGIKCRECSQYRFDSKLGFNDPKRGILNTAGSRTEVGRCLPSKGSTYGDWWGWCDVNNPNKLQDGTETKG